MRTTLSPLSDALSLIRPYSDQRVTSDIKKFSSAIADLYTSLFKPVLDVILFTLKLIQNTGWQVRHRSLGQTTTHRLS